MVLGIVAAVLLALSIGAGVLATMKSMQVKQFQDLLFKAERKIDTLERRMFNVLNAVPVALVETDASGKFTFANRAAHTLLGRKDNELIGLRFHSATWGITFPDGRVVPADMLPIARTLRGQTVKGFQHLIVNHGSHEKILVSVTSMPIMNGNGEVIGSTSAMVELESNAGEGVDDLTGLWRGHWFTAAALPFWGLDAKGQIVDVNNAALDAFDVRREDVLGKTWTHIFVSDADFQNAINYLGEAQDETSPHNEKTIPLTLKGAEGERAMIVSAWAVHTHEGGEHGITVMALPRSEGWPAPEAPAPAAEETPMAFKPASELTDDDAQELEDLRNAEAALASLGIGVWQYDPEAETIVEDEGMRRLIGREYDGGPTLISDDDQARADTAFADLLSGKSDALNLDIRVIDKDQERWITMRGQAETTAAGERQIYGVAFDSTALKTTQPAEVVIQPVTGLTVADVEAARQEALETARKEYEAKLEAAVSEQPGVYGWSDAPAPMTEADPAVVEENAALKAKLENLQAELADAATYQGALRQEIETLKARPEPETPGPADVEENAALKAKLETLQAELVEAADHQSALRQEIEALKARPEPEAPEPVIVREADPDVAEENAALKAKLETLRAELNDVTTYYGGLRDEIALLKSRPEPEAPEPVIVREPDPALLEENALLKARVETLHTELADTTIYHGTLQQQIAALEARPAPVADTSAYEARIAELEARLKDTSEARNELQVQLSDILMAPPIETKDDRDAQIERLTSELEGAKLHGDVLAAKLDALASAPPPKPDTREWEQKVAAAEFEMRKWHAAYEDVQAKLAAVPPPPAVDIDALTRRLDELQTSLNQSLAQQAELQTNLNQSLAQQTELQNNLTQSLAQQTELQTSLAQATAQQSEAQARVEQLSTALSNARRFETVGRLTGDVAQDFAQMLNVINGALDVMGRHAENEQIKKLSEAALAAGKRGERLTRQLQAFQSDDY
ncbi:MULTISPECIES: PAS domain-containing protein [Asticcacaulis]|uniref:PAS domain-containing protein n=1 Tax=Asticcacaulis TaxID=76890 RepID=UPI001FDAC008|nr:MULTISPECIES: PAS domain-containing protein [Asticcacaulis]MBP2159631.1 PAS domain-containing protein/seryl-tRNA synthetase [Asticcacaulis solisilvae]MDR6800542.1 PAS domain-containing protein/seryl-tRNA synthetase [Asticcacaulis sp. BE141]